MLFFYRYSATFQWFSFHYWINNLLYVLSIHSKNLIWMNIVLEWELGMLDQILWMLMDIEYLVLTWEHVGDPKWS